MINVWLLCKALLVTRFPNSYGASNLCVGGGMGVHLGGGVRI